MKKTARTAASLMLSLGLVAAACSSDPEALPATEDSTTTEAPATTTAPEQEEEAMEEEDAMEEDAMEEDAMEDVPATVVDIATSSDDFSILVEAVLAADLAGTLSGDGPFTVFAPTNDAFAAALETLGLTKEELLASPDLAGILTYHVVPAKVLAADAIAADGTEVPTVNGDTIEVKVVDGKVMVDGATVVTTDLVAGNGVVHVIDSVILPG